MENDNGDNISSLTSHIKRPLPDVDPTGTYWVVKAPTHGEKQPSVIGFDEHFNYIYGDKGQVYCANCQCYYFYHGINHVTTCKKCNVSFKAVSWFDRVTYTVEINTRIEKAGLTFEQAQQYAALKRSPKNNIYVYYETDTD